VPWTSRTVVGLAVPRPILLAEASIYSVPESIFKLFGIESVEVFTVSVFEDALPRTISPQAVNEELEILKGSFISNRFAEEFHLIVAFGVIVPRSNDKYESSESELVLSELIVKEALVTPGKLAPLVIVMLSAKRFAQRLPVEPRL